MTYLYLCYFLILAHYTFSFMLAGLSRNKYDVQAPATSGHPVWERMYRVQMNSLEQMALFLPMSFLAAQFWSQIWVAIPAAIFFVARCLYSYQYIKDPTSRASGFIIGFQSTMFLAILTLIGIIRSIFFA